MKSFLSVFYTAVVAISFLLVAPAAHAQGTGGDAGKYVDSLGQEALAVISNSTLSKDQKQAKLDKLFSDSIDFVWVGKFVMGPAWRTATDDQKKRYLTEYQKFLILHYTSRFTEYTGGSFKITGVRDDGDGEFTVSMQLQGDKPDNEPVLVDYRIHKGSAGGLKIFDVIVEGVSLITTQRSEFGSVIAKNGVDYLIDQLSTKAIADVSKPAN